MNSFFTRLGDDIAQRWRACGNTAASFPLIAREALESHAIASRLRHIDLVRGALRSTSWPAQFGSPFGQPPLNVYIGPGFFIEVLTWVESTTAIHQHNFCGAFQVMAGSSLHSAYGFTERERVGNRLLIGDTRFEGSEHLTQGSVREIHSGPGLIHALFHLDHPSATIVVRTVDDGTGPQYLYAKPHIAYDPFWAPEPFATQCRLLNMLAAIKDPGLTDALAEVIEGSDAWCAYRFLEIANRHAHEALDGLIEVAKRRHGALVESMRPGATSPAQRTFHPDARGGAAAAAVRLTPSEPAMTMHIVPPLARPAALSLNRFLSMNPIHERGDVIGLEVSAPVRGEGLRVTLADARTQREDFDWLMSLRDAPRAPSLTIPADLVDRLRGARVLMPRAEVPRGVRYGCFIDAQGRMPEAAPHAQTPWIVNPSLKVLPDTGSFSAPGGAALAGAEALAWLCLPGSDVAFAYWLDASDREQLSRLASHRFVPQNFKPPTRTRFARAGLLITFDTVVRGRRCLQRRIRSRREHLAREGWVRLPGLLGDAGLRPPLGHS